MIKAVACVGILVADIIASPIDAIPPKGMLGEINSISIHNGGNAMTASINLKKLGVSSKIFGKIGKDFLGNFLKDCLKNEGVDTAGLATDENVQTSASVVLSDSSGERTFLHCLGTNAVFSIDDIDFSKIEDVDLVFVTGSNLLSTFDGEQTAEFLKKCKEMGKTTFLDVCWSDKGQWDKIYPALPYIDFFMPSIDEAIEIAKKKDIEEIADVFINHGVKNVILKLGSKGSYLKKSGESKGSCFPIIGRGKPVDTTGAGDSFCSGFISAYARGESLEKCMEVASAVGGLSVLSRGATAGTRSYGETLKFLEEEKCW